jgi:hypothetical protein
VAPAINGLAVNVALCPAQMAREFTAITGAGFTVTVAVADPVPVVEQPDNV